MLDKVETLQRMYGLINVFATRQFCSFQWLLFPLLLPAKSRKLAQFAQINKLFNLCIL